MKVKSIRKEIGGNTYKVYTSAGFFGKFVKVTDTPQFGSKTVYSKRRNWFNRSNKTIETLVKEAVNEAVCKRENKIERKEEYDERIEGAIDTVKEVHNE